VYEHPIYYLLKPSMTLLEWCYIKI